MDEPRFRKPGKPSKLDAKARRAADFLRSHGWAVWTENHPSERHNRWAYTSPDRGEARSVHDIHVIYMAERLGFVDEQA